jgi:hypothetical protein
MTGRLADLRRVIRGGLSDETRYLRFAILREYELALP